MTGERGHRSLTLVVRECVVVVLIVLIERLVVSGWAHVDIFLVFRRTNGRAHGVISLKFN